MRVKSNTPNSSPLSMSASLMLVKSTSTDTMLVVPCLAHLSVAICFLLLKQCDKSPSVLFSSGRER